MTRHLVLVGGGHAHVEVLVRLGRRPAPGTRVTLIARDPRTIYSGMVPGLIAGLYGDEECRIGLAGLARFAGAAFVHAEACGLDPSARLVRLADGAAIAFDLVSLDIGSAPRAGVPGALEHALPVRPIETFLARWEAVRTAARARPGLVLAVAGGGAGGVELALSAEARLRADGARPRVRLVTRGPLLPDRHPRLRARLASELAARTIAVHERAEIVRVEPGALVCADGRRVAFDHAVWATGAAAPGWLAGTGLALDARGFVAVDESLRSLSHAHVFAAGDVATMLAHPRPKAGVHAVRQGPPLTAGLRAALAGAPPPPYRPQSRALALIGTGEARAFAGRGRLVAGGAGCGGSRTGSTGAGSRAIAARRANGHEQRAAQTDR